MLVYIGTWPIVYEVVILSVDMTSDNGKGVIKLQSLLYYYEKDSIAFV